MRFLELGKFSMETVVSGQWWRSDQSLACKGLCILRFCVMSWKGESEPNIKYCLGIAVGLVQRCITIQNLGHNWRRTDGIRVEYIPRIHGITARPRSLKFMNKMGDPEQCQGRFIFMSMFNDIKWWIKDNERLDLYLQKDFQQDIGHSSDLDQKRNGILLTNTIQKENGIELQSRWC